MSSTAELTLERAVEQNEAAVRAALKEALSLDGQPLSRAAPEVGIPYGTLSSWAGGTYAGNSARIAAAVQGWLTSREARARARATLPTEPGFLMTKTASQIWDVLEFSQTTPTMGVVIGGAGVGKTMAFRGYKERYPQTVWIASMQPCHARILAALHEIAVALTVLQEHRVFALAQAITRRMRNTKGLLIIDEAQHLSPETLDQIRSLFDATEIGIVLGGNKELAAHMGADRRRDQLAQIFSRIGMRFSRERPLKADINMLLDAWKIENEAERAELRGIAAQPGGARVLTMVLRIAFGLAAAAGPGAPGVEHIKAAWAQLVGAATGGA